MGAALRRLALLGAAAAGVALLVRRYFRAGLTRDAVQITFKDGSVHEPDRLKAQEFTGIARRLLEIGS